MRVLFGHFIFEMPVIYPSGDIKSGVGCVPLGFGAGDKFGGISIKTVFKVTRGWDHLQSGRNRKARTDPSGSAMCRDWREKSGGTGTEDRRKSQ